MNAGNVKQLGLMWSYNLESTRGVEATPLVVDGVMYVTASWSVVHAIDTRTGQKLWTFDPKVDKAKGFRGCCDVVNRGVALYEGRVYVAAYDGRLIALDAATGQKVWEKDTIDGPKRAYTITGAPRVFKGKVIIGNGGAEYGVRGYVTAYDAKTGDQKWRWFTVPGDPSKPFEDDSMARPPRPGTRRQVLGGGRRRHRLGRHHLRPRAEPDVHRHRQRRALGTQQAQPQRRRQPVPRLDRGARPRHRQVRLALPGDPGRQLGLRLHQPMILADLKIDGKPRKVLLHAPKNGFFFVLDRTNGKFISAKNFVEVNWATGYDKNGRPVETPTRARPKSRATASRARSARTTGTRCRSTRRPALSTCRRRTCRST